MIVEPVPTDPRSRRRRVAARLGLLLPAALLAGVVGVGLAGPSVRVRPAAMPSASTPADGTAVAASPSPGGDPATAAHPVAEGDTGFPSNVDDVPVRTVVHALAARVAGSGGVIAVAGFLGVMAAPAACGDDSLGTLGPLCERSAILAEWPWSPTGSDSFAGIGPHIHVRVPVGVRLPDAVARSLPGAGGAPPPVVAIGRFDALPPSGCSAAGVPCDEGFSLDGIAWAGGAAFPLRPVIDAGIDGNPSEWMLHNQPLAETRVLDPAATVLVAALLRPHTLAAIDPAAAVAAEAGGAPRGLVWYVRGVETASNPTAYPLGQGAPRLVWAVVDDVSGVVVARGEDR